MRGKKKKKDDKKHRETISTARQANHCHQGMKSSLNLFIFFFCFVHGDQAILDFWGTRLATSLAAGNPMPRNSKCKEVAVTIIHSGWELYKGKLQF